GDQVVDVQVVFCRDVNGLEGFLEIGTGPRYGSVCGVKWAIYDLQVLQRGPDALGDAVRHEAADMGQRLEQSIGFGLAAADVGAGLYFGIDDVLLMAVETAHVDRTGIAGIPAFRPHQVGVRHGRDQAALGGLEVQFFVGVAVHQSFLPAKIGYDLLADPHEVQIVEVAATHDQVDQYDVGNCPAPEGN